MSEEKFARPRFSFGRISALAVVLLCIGSVACFIVIGLQRAREARQKTSVLSALKQCAILVHCAHDQLKKLPSYEGPFGQKKAGTFHYHILAFAEGGPQNPYVTADPNAIVNAYLNPQDPTRIRNGAGATNYVINMRLYFTNGGTGELATGDNRVWLKFKQVEEADGLSNTLLFATKYQVCGDGGSLWFDPGKNAIESPTAATFGASMQPWQRAPKQADCDPAAGTAVSFNPKYISVAMCDGSVHTLSADISPATWQALHTWAGKDRVGTDFRSD